MKRKKLLCVILTAMLGISALSGCGGSKGSTANENPGSNITAEDLVVSHDTTYNLEFYDVAANYQGIQPGWYGKIVKDKFNIELNIISPQVSGDGAALYQTRCAAGDLGDLIILDNADMQECVEQNLVMDISNIITNYPNLMRYSEQITAFNKMIGDGTKIYAIPLEMNTNGPTAFKDAHVYTYPRIGWDMYNEVGAPDLKNMDDLLDCLEAIQNAHPKNDKGDSAYAFSLWPDWDSQYMENVAQLTKWYGQEVNGSVMLTTDNQIIPITDKNGAYYKMLKFLFEANQRGLVDPDSATQDWNNVVSKMQDKRVYLFWYSWQYGFWNSPARGEEGVNYIEIPVADTNLYQPSNTYYGDGRVIGVGSQVSTEELARIMEFLDWYASPEGVQIQHAGTEGLVYTKGADGKLTLTEEGIVRFSADVAVPEEMGGGNWNDGNNMINQWIVASVDINPETGETYGSDNWSSYIEMNQTKTTKEWTAKFGSVDDVHYLADKGLMTTVASVNIALDIDTTDISLLRKECGDIIKDSSWKMIYAKDEAEFEAMWNQMCSDLDGLGHAELVEFDTKKYAPVIEARKAAK